MNWFLLILAGLFEVVWALGLKHSDGFSKFWPSVWTLLAMLISIGLLGLAMKQLPVGTAYAIWTGIGAVGTVIVGIVFLGEAAHWGRIVSLVLIISGLIGLKLSS